MVLDVLQSLDASALDSFRSLVDPEAGWQVAAIRGFADAEVFLTAFLLVLIWIRARFLLGNDLASKADALAWFYAIMFAFGLYWILNFGLPARPRPETVSSVAPLINHLPDNSFPSGHGIFAWASATAAYFIFKRKALSIVLLIVGIPMLCARVLAGVHYPGDVIAGFAIGSLFALVATKFLMKKEVRASKLFTVPLAIAAFVRL